MMKYVFAYFGIGIIAWWVTVLINYLLLRYWMHLSKNRDQKLACLREIADDMLADPNSEGKAVSIIWLAFSVVCTIVAWPKAIIESIRFMHCTHELVFQPDN